MTYRAELNNIIIYIPSRRASRISKRGWCKEQSNKVIGQLFYFREAINYCVPTADIQYGIWVQNMTYIPTCYDIKIDTIILRHLGGYLCLESIYTNC